MFESVWQSSLHTKHRSARLRVKFSTSDFPFSIVIFDYRKAILPASRQKPYHPKERKRSKAFFIQPGICRRIEGHLRHSTSSTHSLLSGVFWSGTFHFLGRHVRQSHRCSWSPYSQTQRNVVLRGFHFYHKHPYWFCEAEWFYHGPRDHSGYIFLFHV